MLGISSSLVKGGASLLTFVKDNLKLYLDFKSTKSDTLKFPSEGSTSFAYADKVTFTQQTFTGAFSVVCWFNGDVNTDYKRLFADSSPPSGTNDILVKDVNGQVAIRINGSYKANINNVPNNTWSHLAFTRDDNGNIKAYLNGVQSSTSTSTDTFTLDNIGGDGGGAVMSMCNAGLWSRELTPEEVQSIQNKSYSQLKGVEKTSLVSWWALDSASNGVVQPHDGESTTLISNRDFSGVADGTDPTTLSYIFAYGTPGEKTIDNERLKIVDSNNTGVYWKETGLTSSKLYKITVEATGDVAFNGVYSSDLSFTLSNGTFTGYVTGKTQIIVYLRANDNSAGTTFYDNLKTEEVTSNTGFVTGATTTTSVYGGNAPILPRAVDVAKEGQADAIGNGSALFNGSSEYIAISHSSDLSFGTNPHTISAWAKIDALANFKTIISKRQAGGTATDYNLSVGANGVVYTYNGSAIAQTATGVISTGSWFHYALVYSGSAYQLYINGIAIAWASGTTTSGASNSHDIGIGWDRTGNYWDNQISQVGLWQGALTQSQIQSILESTSYQNLPADVKSTLGADQVTNGTFDSDANWTKNTGWSIGSGVASCDGTQTGNTGLIQQGTISGANLDFEVGKTYKITFDVTTTAGAITYIEIGGTTDHTDVPASDSTVTRYLTASSTNDRLTIAGNSTFEGTVDNVVVKEVFNDIVAYYPLDGDSSANGVTNDVTTGEVLGSEIASNNFGGWTLNGWTDNGNNTASANNSSGGNQDLTISYSFTASTLYKITATFSNISGNFYFSMDGTGGLDKTITTNGEQILYVKTASGGASSFFIRSSNGSSATISNVSIKEVTSNTGVLL